MLRCATLPRRPLKNPLGRGIAVIERDRVFVLGRLLIIHRNDNAAGSIGQLSAKLSRPSTCREHNLVDRVDAKIGEGLDFDEVNDLIRVPDSPSLDSVADEATFELWIWFDNSADGATQIIMSSSNRYGGWDGYDLTSAMFALGIFPYVFSRGGYAAVGVNDDIRAQRGEVISQFRHSPLRRVYDVGCGGAGTLGIIRSMHPDAELIGGDLSARLLTDGHAMSERMGWNITFRQEDGCSVAEADNSCDAVISYALHHEMPQAVSHDVLTEMFRILEPGGEMVISDPPPFRAVPPLQAAILDWETEYRAEPYFTEAGLLDLAQAMQDVGFVDVEEYALQETGYPWVTRGRKPA